MLTDYSSLENEIGSAEEPKVLPAGTEVKVRIIGVRSGTSEKNDCVWHSPIFDVPDDPMVMEFSAFLWELDEEKLDPKSYVKSLYQFKQFATCFGFNFSRPFSWEDDLIGLQGWVILGLKKSEEYGDQNTIKKYIVPPSENTPY